MSTSRTSKADVIVGIDIAHEVASNLGAGARRRGHGRYSKLHRFEQGNAEPFQIRGVNKCGGTPIQRAQFVVVDVAHYEDVPRRADRALDFFAAMAAAARDQAAIASLT